MPHRKITVEHINLETNPDRKWRLAKSAWFHHGTRAARLREMLSRIESPTVENADIQIEDLYVNDVERLKRSIAWHESLEKVYGDLWAANANERKL